MSPATARLKIRATDRQGGAAVAAPREAWQQPLLLWALVLAAALLSFYVHVLNDHVSRNEAQRALQRSAKAAAGAGYTADAQRAAARPVRVAQTVSR